MMCAKGEAPRPHRPVDSDPAHRPVLYQEIIQAIAPQGGGRYVDGTVGAGGHAWGLLAGSRPDGQLLGMDVDPQALALAGERLAEFGGRAELVRASYTGLPYELQRLGWGAVDGIVLDLGASSMQFDTPARGFSFMHQGPLDMRFDPNATLTASEIVNHWEAGPLADLLYKYGEERRSRQIARAIIAARPLETTTELAGVVSKAARSGRRTRLHPATRTFQALRIAVNGELEAIETVLPLAVAALAPGGRLAVIAFHSLEDRIVKRCFRQQSSPAYESDHPAARLARPPVVRLVNRKPIRSGEDEISGNPRARSARLRVVEKY